MRNVSGIGARAARWAQRYIPDPLVLAVVLAAILSLIATTRMAPVQVATSFADGMLRPSLLTFAFQMALILVTGHAFADAPLVRRVLQRAASVPRTCASAAALVAFLSMMLGLLNWGLGLIAGAFLARAVGEAFEARGEGGALNFPLVGAAGYLGLAVWHGGLSGSAPLAAAAETSPFDTPLAVSETLFSTTNVAITAALVVALTALMFFLGRGSPSGAVPFSASPATRADSPNSVLSAPDEKHRLVAFAEDGWAFAWLLALPLVAALAAMGIERGFDALGLNTMILGFLALGLMGHGSLAAYARSFSSGTTGAAGILLQFPIYFGVLAVAQDSGLLADLTHSLTALSPAGAAASFWGPFWTFLSAAAVNVVVPSGGGQWVLQAPVIVEATTTLSVPPSKMLLAFCYGDQLTNLAQPFWALPLLAMTGLKARDVLGYTLLAMVVSFVIVVVGLALM